MFSHQAIDIIIPVYKNAELTKRCIDSVLKNIDEIKAHSPRLLIVNDSPDDQDVNSMLEQFAASNPEIIFFTNEKNYGFVKSVNRCLEKSVKEDRDVILINSDTETFVGTLFSLIDAGNSDPQIGFISPRSNNASICTLPQASYTATLLSPTETYARWQEIKSTFPQVHFTPTAIGFYMFIKHKVLANFGYLSEEFGVGYEEENDLIMRANKAGYRAALANHSFAFHAGSASFNLLDLDLHNHRNTNLQKMMEIHPEFLPLVHRYEASPHFRAEQLMSGLVGHKSRAIKVVIDLSGMGCNHNGTNELALNIIKGLSHAKDQTIELSVLCTSEVFKYHKIDKLGNIIRVDFESPGKHAVAIRLGQPFDQHHINVLESLAPVNVYGMLDTIAEDSGYLSITHDLCNHWQHVAQHSNGLFFISQFSETTFCHRYPAAGALPKYTKLLPTRLSSYESERSSLKAEHVLILGNHFAHKASDVTAAILAKSFPSVKFAVLGASTFEKANLQGYRSGTLEPETVAMLFARASVVVLPSHVEGFGFGLMHALAARKPVVARNIDATKEILSTYKNYEGVFLYNNDLEVQNALRSAMKTSQSIVNDHDTIGWNEWADGLLEYLKSLMNESDLFSRACNRLYASDQSRRAEQNLQLAMTHHHIPAGLVTQMKSADDLDTLLKLEGIQFVERAYLAILNRLPDPVGLNHHMILLRQGTPKLQILLGLQDSPEGKATNTELSGLREAVLRSKKSINAMLKNIFSSR
jgi:GT2 family glycosyltransferase